MYAVTPVCAGTVAAHIHTDENAAPERVAGLKLLTVPTPDETDKAKSKLATAWPAAMG